MRIFSNRFGRFERRSTRPPRIPVGVWAGTALFLSALAAVPASAQTVFDNFNGSAVANGPSNPTTFTVSAPTAVRQLITYHWNYGRGAQPGTIRLRNIQNQQQFGPYGTAGTSGQGGVSNVAWVATINGLVIPAGTYLVEDSDRATWSQNAQSGARGFVRVYGSASATAQGPVAPAQSPAPPVLSQCPTPYPNCTCHGPGCTHPDLRSFGGDGPVGTSAPISLHRQVNQSAFLWLAMLSPYTAVGSLSQTCSNARGTLQLLDDEPWYYYYTGYYARFGCAR
jgi:hypothetical protein